MVSISSKFVRSTPSFCCLFMYYTVLQTHDPIPHPTSLSLPTPIPKGDLGSPVRSRKTIRLGLPSFRHSTDPSCKVFFFVVHGPGTIPYTSRINSLRFPYLVTRFSLVVLNSSLSIVSSVVYPRPSSIF